MMLWRCAQRMDGCWSWLMCHEDVTKFFQSLSKFSSCSLSRSFIYTSREPVSADGRAATPGGTMFMKDVTMPVNRNRKLLSWLRGLTSRRCRYSDVTSRHHAGELASLSSCTLLPVSRPLVVGCNVRVKHNLLCFQWKSAQAVYYEIRRNSKNFF